MEPYGFNIRVALPNKFFDFIIAGLAVIIGPSPAMAELVNKYRFGVMSLSFDPRNLATTLISLTSETIAEMKYAAQQAAQQVNARTEMGKVVDLYGRLFESIHTMSKQDKLQ